VLLGHRDDGVLPGHRLGHQFDDRGRDGHVVQGVDKGNVVEVRNGAAHLGSAGIARFHQGVLELDALALSDGEGFVELLGAENSLLDEDVGEVTASLGHGTSLRSRRANRGRYLWGAEGPKPTNRDPWTSPSRRVSASDR